jgi:cell division protein ZapA
MSPEPRMKPPIKVQIFGQTYVIQGDLEESYVRELAAGVDAKMHAVARATALVDTQKIAVLAALAFADQLYGLRRERQEQEEVLKEQAERCLNLVERALKQTA